MEGALVSLLKLDHAGSGSIGLGEFKELMDIDRWIVCCPTKVKGAFYIFCFLHYK
jgi:hypothetical protein